MNKISESRLLIVGQGFFAGIGGYEVLEVVRKITHELDIKQLNTVNEAKGIPNISEWPTGANFMVIVASLLLLGGTEIVRQHIVNKRNLNLNSTDPLQLHKGTRGARGRRSPIQMEPPKKKKVQASLNIKNTTIRKGYRELSIEELSAMSRRATSYGSKNKTDTIENQQTTSESAQYLSNKDKISYSKEFTLKILNEKYHGNQKIVNKITRLLNSQTVQYKKLHSAKGKFVEIISHEWRILLKDVDGKLVPIYADHKDGFMKVLNSERFF